ncbi:MAG: cytidine deaminase [Bacteroidota bacterium]
MKADVRRTLIREALKARGRSHSPYSRFRVGAALLTSRGRIFTGCNIEVSSFGLTICAERTAMFKARSEGFSSFRAIAIATDSPAFVSPCGACRQVLLELGGDLEVILANAAGASRTHPLHELLPHAFGPQQLARGRKRR